MKIVKYTFTLFILILSIKSYAVVGPTTVTGKITNITSINSGILVRIAADEVPESCTTTTKWMEIKQEKTAMISLTLAAWTLNKEVTVYASGSSGYCQVNQVHPSSS